MAEEKIMPGVATEKESDEVLNMPLACLNIRIRILRDKAGYL